MAQCVFETSDGFLKVQQADDISVCQYVLVSPAEYKTFSNSVWNLSIEDAMVILPSCIFVFAIGWIFRQCILALNVRDSVSED